MNQAQAIAKLGKLLGSKFAYRLDKGAPTAEQRENIRMAWKTAKQAEEDAVAARKARHEALLQDPEYQELSAKATALKTATELAGSGLHRYRVAAGAIQMGFFNVEADGDNWDEVVAKVTEKRTK